MNEDNNQIPFNGNIKKLNEIANELSTSMQETLSITMSALGNVISETTQSVDSIRELAIDIASFTHDLRSAVLETFTRFDFESCRQNIINNLIYECEASGSMGWCFYGIDILSDNLPFIDFYEAKNHIKSGKVTTARIDEYITKCLPKETIEKVAAKTEMLLSPEDANKLKKAMIDFRAKRYYDSANLLAGLIDSQSIKELLFHSNPKDNISQGWQAFAIAYKNKFSNKLDTSLMKPKSKKREEEFLSFVNTNKENKHIDTQFITQNLLLCYSLLSFFQNNDWRDYPNNKPAVINRHWLAHGMYDYHDIKKSDCLKLLFMLNQIANLFKSEG